MPGPLMQALPDSTSPLQIGYPATLATTPAVPAMDLRPDIIVLPDMTNPNYRGCGNCGHGAYGTMYYGGPPNAGGEYNEPGLMGAPGFSVDQVVGDAFATMYPDLRVKTLPLQVMVDTYTADGTTGAHRCFWRGAGNPVTPSIDPFVAYSTLFGSPPGSGMMMGSGSGGMTMPDPTLMKLLAEKRSILDFVGKDLQRFGSRLGTDAQQAINNHLTSIRDVEKLLAGMAGGGGGVTTPTAIPIDWSQDTAAQMEPTCKSAALNGGLPCWFLNTANYPAVLDVHMKLGVLALASGVTQVVTLQTVDATGDAKEFTFVKGVPGSPTNTVRNGQDLHAIAHNPVQGGVDVKQLIDKWFMGQFAKLIQLMKAVPEGSGTLLDSSVILWGNHMQSGDNHLSQAVPWMLAGSAGGYFKTGQLAASKGQPIGGVLTEICNAMGVPPSPTFGPAMAGLH
jgi:hypothetical protein